MVGKYFIEQSVDGSCQILLKIKKTQFVYTEFFCCIKMDENSSKRRSIYGFH